MMNYKIAAFKYDPHRLSSSILMKEPEKDVLDGIKKKIFEWSSSKSNKYY